MFNEKKPEEKKLDEKKLDDEVLENVSGGMVPEQRQPQEMAGLENAMGRSSVGSN